jgi:hypothetical protein
MISNADASPQAVSFSIAHSPIMHVDANLVPPTIVNADASPQAIPFSIVPLLIVDASPQALPYPIAPSRI